MKTRLLIIALLLLTACEFYPSAPQSVVEAYDMGTFDQIQAEEDNAAEVELGTSQE